MTDRLDRLAALLREEASRDADRLADLIEQSAYSEPADPLAAWPRYWIGPFPAVGVVPLPYETVVRVTLRRGTEYGPKPVDSFCWGQSGGMADIVAFSYLADNPEGWLPRPEGWVPPDEAWGLGLRWTTLGKHGTPDTDGAERRLFFDEDWEGVTHIRFSPLGPAVGPELATNGDFLMGTSGWRSAPIPADVQAVVREALRVALAWSSPHSDSAELIRKALAALDAAPAEGETVGYGVMDKDLESPIFAKLYKTSREARENGIFCKSTQRIVKLVEVPDQ